MGKKSKKKAKTFTEEELLSSLKVDGPQLTLRGLHNVRIGDGETSYMIGLWYLSERGRHNYPKALAWFRRGDAQNNSGAQTEIGCMYLRGHGVPKDEKLAIEWLNKAADNNGNRNACALLGQIYERGTGVPKDPRMAIEWYSRGAMKGHPTAQWRLGCVYEEVEEVRNVSHGGFWKRRAPDHEDMYIHDHLHKYHSIIDDPDMDCDEENIEGLWLEDYSPIPSLYSGPPRPAQIRKAESPAKEKQKEPAKEKQKEPVKEKQKEPGQIIVTPSTLQDHQYKTLKKMFQQHLTFSQEEKAEHKKEMEALKEETATIEARLKEKDDEINQLKEDLARYKSKFKNKARS